ncbi:MAG: hypothetical protein ACRCUP_01380 [Mycoplasmatales bacterium]
MKLKKVLEKVQIVFKDNCLKINKKMIKPLCLIILLMATLFSNNSIILNASSQNLEKSGVISIVKATSSINENKTISKIKLVENNTSNQLNLRQNNQKNDSKTSSAVSNTLFSNLSANVNEQTGAITISSLEKKINSIFVHNSKNIDDLILLGEVVAVSICSIRIVKSKQKKYQKIDFNFEDPNIIPP